LEGYTLIPPFDDVEVIAGQGTIGKELLEQDTHLTHVFVPVGGGGLAAGVAVYIKQLLPDVKVIGWRRRVRLPQGGAGGRRAGQSGAGLPVCGRGGGQAHRQETFRLCNQYLDEVVTVSNDQICAALKDIFDDCRAIAEPSRALSLAGLKAYSERAGERADGGHSVRRQRQLPQPALRVRALRDRREARGHAGGDHPRAQGAFLDFCRQLGPRMVTEFNYRYADAEQASLFVSVRLTGGDEELGQIIDQLGGNGYPVVNMTESELAKNHVRYMIGGRPAWPSVNASTASSFRAAGRPDALETLGCRWNISLFHYRNHGADYGRVLCAFELPDEDVAAFHDYLHEIGYGWKR
jgi:threonine dehydratase